MALTVAQQAARDKLKATRIAQKASGLSNKDILRRTQGVSSSYVRPVATTPQNRTVVNPIQQNYSGIAGTIQDANSRKGSSGNYDFSSYMPTRETTTYGNSSNYDAAGNLIMLNRDPQLGTQTNKNGINISSYGPVVNPAPTSYKDPSRVYTDNSVSGTYQRELAAIDPAQLAAEARGQFEPGLDRRIDTYKDYGNVLQGIKESGQETAQDQRDYYNQLYGSQSAEAERDYNLASDREQAIYDQLVGQADISRQDVQRAFRTAQERANQQTLEATGYLERQLPEATMAAQRQAAKKGLASTTQAVGDIAAVGEEFGRQIGSLQTSNQITQADLEQQIAISEQDYNNKLLSYKNDQMNNLAALDNAYLAQKESIMNNQSLSENQVAEYLRQLDNDYAKGQYEIQQNIVNAEVETENLIQQTITQLKNQAEQRALQTANFRQTDISNEASYLGTYQGQQTLGAKQQELANIAQQIQTRAMEAAITGYDPVTGKQTFDMQKYEESLNQFAQEMGLRRDQLDELIRSNMASEDIARGKASQAGTMTPEEKAKMEIQLANNFQKYAKDSQTALRSIGNVNAGYESAVSALKEGEPLNAQSQAVIIGFNKLLDPTSVVRESEYARTPEGQSLLQSLEGEYISITQGGAGLTEEGLRNIKDMALQLAEGYKNEQLGYAQLIANQADSYGLNLENILPPDQLSLYYGYDVNTDAGSADLSDIFENSKKKMSNQAAQKLLTAIPAPQGLKEIAAAIMQHEGYDVNANGGRGTLAVRNNNPGNLRYIGQEGGSQGEGGFAKFNSLESGFMALINDIKAKATGNTRTGLNGNSTLYDLFKVYAPASDNNNPKVYAEAVANKLGVSPYAKIGTLIA